MAQHPLKIGLMAIGLDTYWSQFNGLKERLENYLKYVDERMQQFDATIINVGMVDCVDKSFEAGSTFRKNEVDIIFLYATTYALSSTVLPAVQKSNVPVVILNLSPENAIDYDSFNKLEDRTKMTGEWLAYCSACPVPEISNVFKRCGIQFHQVTGILYDDDCWSEIREWIEAARVKHIMNYNRLGCIGNYYSGMLDIYTDLTIQYKVFGGHIELLELDELSALRNDVKESEIDARVSLFKNKFHVQQDCLLSELQRAAKTSIALDILVEKYKLGSLAYYYKGVGNDENANTASSIIIGNSLLTAKNIPVAGEYEIKNVQAMKILDSFNAGGSFSEYYAMDYKDDVVLMGHDGPGHIAIAEGQPLVKPLAVYHGKVGKGLSIEMSVMHGPVTLLSVIENNVGGLSLLIAEGDSVPGPILKIGNTNSRYRFSMGAKNFVSEWNKYGPAHHCAIGVGRISSKLKKFAALLNIDFIEIK